MKEASYLLEAFNDLAKKESVLVTKMRYLLDSYGMSNLILNIFKVLKDGIDKKEHKNKHKFFQKGAKDCCIQTLLYTYKNEKNFSLHKLKNSLKRKYI